MKLKILETKRGRKKQTTVSNGNGLMVSASGKFKVTVKNSRKKKIGAFIQNINTTLSIPRNQGVKYVEVENLDLSDFNIYVTELEF